VTVPPARGDGFTIWRFGVAQYDDRRRELKVDGRVVDVESKPLDVLHYLLRHAGEAVTKDELLDAVWPGVTVVDGSLATAVSKLRKALGADADVIVTLPKVGYRLAASVHRCVEPNPFPGEVVFVAGGEVPRRPGWRLLRPLGSPGSEVWLAEHAKTREQRVFKFALTTDRRLGLEREVTVSRLLREVLGDRDDYVRVLEWQFDAPPYTVESAYGGITLADWCDERGGPAAVPLRERLAIMSAACEAVGAAHAVDVLHKDLKPSNILISSRVDGTPLAKVADFGSASLLSPERLASIGITNLGFSEQATEPATVMGSLTYVAPELLLGQMPTPASDVFALGVLLYQIVVGDFRRPLAPGWEADVADAGLRALIASAADGRPDRRMAGAATLAERLSQLTPSDTPAPPLSPRGRAAQTRGTLSQLRVMLVAALGLLVLAAGGTLLWRTSSAGTAETRTEAAVPARITSLAVMPLVNLSGDPSQDYLADGVSGALIADLSGIRALRVMSWSTTGSFRHSDRTVAQVARELGVEAIIEGSLARTDRHVRLTARLVHGLTGATVWTRSYEGDTTDLFRLQRMLARQIAEEVGVAILPAETRALEARWVDPQAYDLYLRGRFFWNRRTRDDLLRAVDYFSQAATVDHKYALAHAGLADAYAELVGFGNLAPSDGIPKAKAAAGRAIAIDPGLAEGHAALAYAHAADWDWHAADAEFRQALSLNPGYVVALYQYGFFLSLMGRQAEAMDLVERALARDPLSPVVRYRAGRVYYQARQFEKAHAQFEKILELNPSDPLGIYGHGLVYAAQGDFARALDYLDRQPLQRGFDAAAVLAASGQHSDARRRLEAGIRRHEAAHDYLRPGWVAEVYASLGDSAEAIKWLRRGYAERDAWLALVKVWPAFDPLRSDPAFAGLLADMRFPQ